jgi:hypothetical protein
MGYIQPMIKYDLTIGLRIAGQEGAKQIKY